MIVIKIILVCTSIGLFLHSLEHDFIGSRLVYLLKLLCCLSISVFIPDLVYYYYFELVEVKSVILSGLVILGIIFAVIGLQILIFDKYSELDNK